MSKNTIDIVEGLRGLENEQLAKQYAREAYAALDNFTAFIPYELFAEHHDAIYEVKILLHKHM